MLNDSQACSSGGGVERTPRTKASVDVVGAGGVAAGGGKLLGVLLLPSS